MNALHESLLSIAYRVARRFTCCDCRLPGFIARYWFEPNCFCSCHEHHHGRGVRELFRRYDWALVYGAHVVGTTDPTQIVKLSVKHGGLYFNTTPLELFAFWDTIELRVTRGKKCWTWRPRHPFLTGGTRRQRARKWLDARFAALLWRVLYWAQDRAQPSSEDAEADRLMYGGE